MDMRAAAVVGIALIVCAPFALLIGNRLGLIMNLVDTIQIVIVSLVPAMIVSGASLIWLGQKPDEQELRRKEDIHGAIKKWVELPTAQFLDKQGTLPLAETSPELGEEIEECLSHEYESIHADLRKLRQEYHEWKNDNSFERFTTVKDGKTIVNVTLADSYDREMTRKLLSLHSQVVGQINSEIIQKHFTRLKC